MFVFGSLSLIISKEKWHTNKQNYLHQISMERKKEFFELLKKNSLKKNNIHQQHQQNTICHYYQRRWIIHITFSFFRDYSFLRRCYYCYFTKQFFFWSWWCSYVKCSKKKLINTEIFFRCWRRKLEMRWLCINGFLTISKKKMWSKFFFIFLKNDVLTSFNHLLSSSSSSLPAIEWFGCPKLSFAFFFPSFFVPHTHPKH